MIVKLLAVVAVFAVVEVHAANPLIGFKRSINKYNSITSNHKTEFKKVEKALEKTYKAGYSNIEILRSFIREVKSPEDLKNYREIVFTLRNDKYDAEETIFFFMDKLREIPARKKSMRNLILGSAFVMTFGFPRT